MSNMKIVSLIAAERRRAEAAVQARLEPRIDQLRADVDRLMGERARAAQQEQRSQEPG